jgi:hypothetical protein
MDLKSILDLKSKLEKWDNKNLLQSQDQCIDGSFILSY